MGTLKGLASHSAPATRPAPPRFARPRQTLPRSGYDGQSPSPPTRSCELYVRAVVAVVVIVAVVVAGVIFVGHGQGHDHENDYDHHSGV